MAIFLKDLNTAEYLSEVMGILTEDDNINFAWSSSRLIGGFQAHRDEQGTIYKYSASRLVRPAKNVHDGSTINDTINAIGLDNFEIDINIINDYGRGWVDNITSKNTIEGGKSTITNKFAEMISGQAVEDRAVDFLRETIAIANALGNIEVSADFSDADAVAGRIGKAIVDLQVSARDTYGFGGKHSDEIIYMTPQTMNLLTESTRPGNVIKDALWTNGTKEIDGKDFKGVMTFSNSNINDASIGLVDAEGYGWFVMIRGATAGPMTLNDIIISDLSARDAGKRGDIITGVNGWGIGAFAGTLIKGESESDGVGIPSPTIPYLPKV